MPLGAGASEQQRPAAGPPALFGQGDHAAGGPAALTMEDRVQLARRAVVLLTVFLPFLLLGPILLLLAQVAGAGERRQAAAPKAVAGAGRTPQQHVSHNAMHVCSRLWWATNLQRVKVVVIRCCLGVNSETWMSRQGDLF